MDKKVNTIVCIQSFMSRTDAEVAKSALSAGKISAYIQADDAGGAYPFPFANKSAGAQLFVRQSDLKKAQAIIQKM